MVTQVAARNTCWLDGIAVAGQDLRLALAGLMTPVDSPNSTGIGSAQGVRLMNNGLVNGALGCLWTSGMQFNLAAGTCWVQGTASTTAGLFELVLDTTTLFTVPASDPTNPRIDSVIAVVIDNGDNTSTALFRILPGTPAGSPSAPSLPANALRMWNIAVGAGVSTLSQIKFTDVRSYNACLGGILPVADASVGTTNGSYAQYIHDLKTGRLMVSNGGGGVAYSPQVTPYPPYYVADTSPSVTTAGPIALCVATIACDGNTEIEVTGQYDYLVPTSPAVGDYLTFEIGVGGVAVHSWVVRIETTSTHPGMTAAFRDWFTPAPGNHTVSFTVSLTGSGSASYQLVNARMRVSNTPG